MKLEKKWQERFEAIDHWGKVADLQRKLNLKDWGNVQKILLGEGGTSPKRISIIIKFILNKEKEHKQINEVE